MSNIAENLRRNEDEVSIIKAQQLKNQNNFNFSLRF